MKDGFFQLRISKQDREALCELARFYNLSASSVICMLISKEARTIEKENKNESIKSI